MAYKNKNLQNKENSENKKHIKFIVGISSKKFIEIFLKFLLVILVYNSFSMTEEKSLEIRILENSSKIKMIINGSDGD